MQTLRKCPHCQNNSISLFDVAHLMMGADSLPCRHCNGQVSLSAEAKKKRSLFWMIEFVMYGALLYFSFYFKSWSVFAWGLCLTMTIEITMLYLKPLVRAGDDSIEREL